ncbi:MAG: LysE family transporter [Solirubrobacterales bacterium]|nr:LysE family transporter [Solirubrobacterales bacterium]
MALGTRNALQHGRRSAVATALGVNLRIVVWTGAAGLGLAALIAASAAAFAAIKLAGALNLIYLGVQTLRHSGAGSAEGATSFGLPINDGVAVPPRPSLKPAEPENRRLLHEPPAPVRGEARDGRRPARAWGAVQRDGGLPAPELRRPGRPRPRRSRTSRGQADA